MAKHRTRRQLVLREKAGEFERDACMVDIPLRLRSGRYNLFEHQTSEHADYYSFAPTKPPYDCWRYAHFSECCDSCHEYHDPRAVRLLNGEVVHVCCAIDRAIRPAYHEVLRRARLEKDMCTAEGHKFLATTWLSLFPFDEVSMFALQAWNETASEGEKVDFISTIQEEEVRRSEENPRPDGPFRRYREWGAPHGE